MRTTVFLGADFLGAGAAFLGAPKPKPFLGAGAAFLAGAGAAFLKKALTWRATIVMLG